MFTYLDPTIRKRLVAEGKLIRIDREGHKLGPDESGGGQAISMLGPIPLPLTIAGRHIDVTWYACVRNTCLLYTSDAADDSKRV